MSDVLVRRAESGDDLPAIASCLYLTDPFIYPAAFGSDPQRAAQAITALMNLEGNLFHLANLAVALQGDAICGALLLNESGTRWDAGECAEAMSGIVPNIAAFARVSDAYFSAEAADPPLGTVELVACCVVPEFRNRGIGRMLLEWLIKENGDSVIALDVLADNAPAIALYKKCGFIPVRSFKGFALSEDARPDCYRMERVPRF